MASIFDSLADTTAAPPKTKGTGSIFDDLEGPPPHGEAIEGPRYDPARGGSSRRATILEEALSVPPPPKPRPGTIPGNEISGSRFVPPKLGIDADNSFAASELRRTAANREGLASVADSLWTGVKNFSPRNAVSATADLLDISLGSIASGILATAGEVTNRSAALVHGRGWKSGGEQGAAFSQSMSEQFGRPFYDNLVAVGALKKDGEVSLPQQAMEKIGGMLEHGGTIVEQDSGGAISKNDYLAAINAFMAGMGVKGFHYAAQKRIAAKGEAQAKSAWDTALERFDAEEQLARQVETERDAAKLTTPVADAAKIRLMARQPSEATRTKEQARKDARAAFSTPEAEAQAGVVDRQAAYREELAAQEAAVRDRFPPSGERTGSRGPVDLTLEGKETPTSQPGNQPFHTADATQSIKRGIVADTPIETEGALRPAARPSLDTGLEKVKSGRLFDMTMEERLAVKNSVDITDPKVITAAAVGATGLGLAMLYEPSAEEAAMAIGAGALLRRGGEGMPMRELLAKPEATPLGALLESSAYTTRTLERLAEASPGKFEYKKAQIEQLLKQSDVTAHERGIMQEALASVPGDMITAKGLLTGVRMAAKDFELTPAKSDSYASYGLERIDRDPGLNKSVAEMFGVEDSPDTTGATTRIYRSPLELGSNNHFSDPNYFAHTRSFVEDGVRHVVELQSDLAQKAGKVLSPDERAKLLSERDAAQAKIEELLNPINPDRAASLAEVRRLRALQAEANSKLAAAGTGSAVAPMLKDWHKRLVREELADAARNLEPSVRFATADTVAKVEGWPKAETTGDMLLDRELYNAREQLQIRGPEGVNLHGERYADVITRLQKSPDYQPGRFSPQHQGIYDRYSRDVEKFLRQLGAQPITDSAGHTWLEVPLGEQQKALPGGGARTQIGGVDPALAKAVGAVGGSAALAWMLSRDKDKAKHAAMAGVLTGLGLLAYARNAPLRGIIDQTIHGVQQVAGNLSTDKAVSAPLLRRFTEHARAELKNIHDSGRKISPFLEIASKVPDAARAQLNIALANGRTSDVVAAIGNAATPGLLKAWNDVQLELKAMGTQLKDLGLIKDLRQDYFPRIVKDVPGLLTKLGKEAVPLQRLLNAAEKAAGGVLDEAERSAIVNKFLEKNLRSGGVGGKASFFKHRTIDNVTIDLEPFYVEPLQALPLYMASAVRAIEKAKFFGKDAVRDPVTGKLHLEGSIGNVVNAEVASGQMSPENFNRLTKLLETRFGPAYAAPARPLRALSQVTNIALLGNVFSGMMNLADIGGIMAQQGILSTVSAVVKKIRKQHKITAADVGMADHIMEEFVYGTREPVRIGVPFSQRTVQLSLAKAVDKTFKFSGFKAFDQVMKEVHLNAAMENYSRMSRSKAGEAKIIRQYGDYFTTDMPQLLADLRSGAKTKLTTELAFRELSDAQPITKIEMPQFYLDHPNLRYGYALKSFAIKQLNLVKKRGVDEIAKGNVRDGMGFLVRYALLAGSAGAGMDWIIKSLLGRDADTDWGVIPFNVLKNIGISEYAIDKARQGKGKEAILMATVPPMDPVLNIITADPKAVRYFPLVGRLVYDRFMDGAEKANAAKKLAEKKKAAEDRRTPAERRELERRALERRKALTQ